MTGDLGRIGNDRVIANLAVVSNVYVVHEQDIVADPRNHPAALGATMDRSKFADFVVVTDLQSRRLAPVLEILRVSPNRRELEDSVARPDRGVALDYDIWSDHSLGADSNLRADNRTGLDNRGRIDLRPPIDYCRGMNPTRYGSCPSTSIAESSASAANSPSTRASPRIFQSGW